MKNNTIGGKHNYIRLRNASSNVFLLDTHINKDIVPTTPQT